jgi:F-type H+-transporting ATPase subunit b
MTLHRRLAVLAAGSRLACIATAAALVPALLPAAEEAEHGGHAAPAEAPLVPQTIWAIVSFLIVLAVLLKYLIPPIIQAMDKRAADIRDALAAAEKAKADAEELIKRHHADLETARKDAAAIIEEGKADANKVRESIVAEARRDAQELAARAKRDIERAKDDALVVLKKASVEMAVDIAAGLIQKSLNPAEHQQLIEERIRRLQGTGPRARGA